MSYVGVVSSLGPKDDDTKAASRSSDRMDRVERLDRSDRLGGFKDIDHARFERLEQQKTIGKDQPVSRGGAVATFGVGVSTLEAFGVGVGADVTESWRPGSGMEGSMDTFLIAGPIISVSLPVNPPSFVIGLSAPPDKSRAVDPVECSPMVMLASPLAAAQVTFDSASHDLKSFSLSVGLAIQLGAGVGTMCSFNAR